MPGTTKGSTWHHCPKSGKGQGNCRPVRAKGFNYCLEHQMKCPFGHHHAYLKSEPCPECNSSAFVSTKSPLEGSSTCLQGGASILKKRRRANIVNAEKPKSTPCSSQKRAPGQRESRSLELFLHMFSAFLLLSKGLSRSKFLSGEDPAFILSPIQILAPSALLLLPSMPSAIC